MPRCPAPAPDRLARAQRGLGRALLAWIMVLGLALAEPGIDKLLNLATQRYGKAGGEAVAAWRQLLADSAPLAETDKLARVNGFFNQRIHYDSDQAIWGKSDYWASPLETLGRGAGDCEDFTIAKYVTLKALGVPDHKLRLIYVRAQIGGPASGILQAHMVLGYYPSPTEEPLVLDSLLNEIRPASRRPDLAPVFSFNGEGLWIGGASSVADPTTRLSRWRDLLARMTEEGFE